MRILITSIGSLGDVLPLMSLGAQLQARGHEVRFYGNAYFRYLADDLALHFTATSPASEYQAFLDSPPWRRTLNKAWPQSPRVC